MSTDHQTFSVPEITASASSGRMLHPGDVILSGTPGGAGFTRTPEFLGAGDLLEAEIKRVGVLRNRFA